jgi:hypothetical protein
MGSLRTLAGVVSPVQDAEIDSEHAEIEMSRRIIILDERCLSGKVSALRASR